MKPTIKKSEIVVISMGSNIENRLYHLINAIKLLSSHQSIKLEECSPIYESKSQGFDSDDFYNNIIIISTTLSPFELLQFTQKVECEIGRNKSKTRTKNYMARKIDIDIIFFGNKYIQISELIIPHPETYNRDFVKIPIESIKKSINLRKILILETNLLSQTKNTLKLCEKDSIEFDKTFNQLKHE